MRRLAPDARVFVAGHRGLVGSAIVRCLERKGFNNLVKRTRAELDLLDQAATRQFFRDEKIDFVFMAAGKVGGVHANATQQADFLYENLALASHVIHAAAESGVEKLLFLGSSCIYPKEAPQPIREEALLTGPLEPTNEGYAVAKIAGLKLCEMLHSQYGKRFISAMPTNLYGPGDNFSELGSHVIPGMMRRFHFAKIEGAREVKVWGTGTPRREFLHVDDLARACVLLMEEYEEKLHVNVGAGKDCSISELATLMKDVVGFEGTIEFDASKPDGMPRKLLDSTRMNQLGWRAEVPLRQGLVESYQWAVQSNALGYL